MRISSDSGGKVTATKRPSVLRWPARVIVAFKCWWRPMSKCLTRFMALVALIATPALAADLTPAPIYTKAPPAPAYSWTGFYVGGNIGYSWGTDNSVYNDPNFGASGTGALSYNPLSENLDGVIGGGQIGYNWQANSTWVLGFEADIQGSGERGGSSFSDPYSVGVDCDIFCSTVGGTMNAAINWFGTLRGRVGVLVTPTTLLYGTGGLAYGGVSASGTITDACFSGKPPTCTPASWGFGNTSTQVGWTVGGGVEGVAPISTNWTWKLEYLYLDLGTMSGSGYELPADFGVLPYTWSTRVTDNILRVGLNYHFH
jgi:outer membrane immunogenic protein